VAGVSTGRTTTAGALGAGPLTVTLVAFAVMVFGGWLGGTMVFVHGMRVLGLDRAPALEAIKPGEPDESKRAA
jgi:hypothetical protein